jgi:hypothetical protein
LPHIFFSRRFTEPQCVKSHRRLLQRYIRGVSGGIRRRLKILIRR